jgi:ligand-binding sensor domain-containing protein
MKYYYLIILLAFTYSCQSQEYKNTPLDHPLKEGIAPQIAQYVVDVLEDSKGNLWFATLNNGIAKYDGKTLKYFTRADGLPNNRVVSIVEDKTGILWIGTGLGISKYDGITFSNFSSKDGLCDDRISNLYIDSKGMLWIGTWGGICQFDGSQFIAFTLPYPNVDTPINNDTKDWITDITEDAEGNIWIGRDGYGATKYDGTALSYITKKDGLHSNNVTEIEMDQDGNLWFGTRVAEKDNPDPEKRSGKGGINKYDGNTFISFPDVAGFNNDDVYAIYRDHTDNIWISTTNNGVYKYMGEEFIPFEVPISIMSMIEDRNGNLWLGGAGGLYRINTKGIVNVTSEGPWN